MRVQRTLIVMLVVGLAGVTATACDVRVAGKRCAVGSPFAQDATHVLECKGGRWTRVATKVEVALRLAAYLHTVPSSVDVGDGHACAVMVDTKVRCWGRNDAGQLGDGTTTDRSIPGDVSGLQLRSSDGRNWAPGAVVLGDRYSCGLADTYVRATSYSDYFCWGALGEQNTTSPVKFGGDHIDRSVFGPTGACWTEQYAVGSWCSGTGVMSPIQADGSATVGRAHECVVGADDGLVTCVGANDHGQLGDGSTTSIPLPAPFTKRPALAQTGVIRPVHLVAGGDTTCATPPGWGQLSIVCWGRNDHGQVGDGSTVDRLSPTPVPGPTGIIDLDLGSDHACAIGGEARLWCWGANTNGQLGDGTTTDRSTPTVVPGLTNVSRLAAGAGSTCAIADLGAAKQQLYCWGRNDHGQVGDGTTTERHEPTLVRF